MTDDRHAPVTGRRAISICARWVASLLAVFSAVAGMGRAEESPTDSGKGPVQAQLAIERGSAPEDAVAVLTLTVAPTWHVYVKSSHSQVLEIDLDLPKGVDAKGDWIWPKPRVMYKDERVEVYTGVQVLRRHLKQVPSASGNLTVRATLRFQACDPSICRPPEQIAVTAKLSGNRAEE